MMKTNKTFPNVSFRPIANPVVYEDDWNAVVKAIDFAVEQGITPTGVDHQFLTVYCQHPDGNSDWGKYVREGTMLPEDIIWVKERLPKNERPIYRAVRLDLRGLSPEAGVKIINLRNKKNLVWLDTLRSRINNKLAKIKASQKTEPVVKEESAFNEDSLENSLLEINTLMQKEGR